MKNYVMLPHEHGAWAMFVIPLLIGMGAGHAINGTTVLFAMTALGFFLLRHPLMLALKSRAPNIRRDAMYWSGIYSALTCISGVILLLTSQLWTLIPIGGFGLATLAVYLLLAVRRAEMSTAGEWIGIAGLALSAPGAYLASSGRLDATALALYTLNLLYFGGTISYVKFKVREQPLITASASDVGAKLWAGHVTLAYHLLVLIIGALLASIGLVPTLAAVSFWLPTCKVISGIMSRPSRPNLPRLGFIELGFTIAFALVVLAAYA